MANERYELTDDTIEFDGRTLHRIRSLQEGVMGGYIESELNLSTDLDDDSWVHDNSRVYGTTELSNNSVVREDSTVKDSKLSNAEVVGSSNVDESNLTNSTVNKSEVLRSDIKDSLIQFDSYVDRSNINQSTIEDESEVEDSDVSYSTVSIGTSISRGSNVFDSILSEESLVASNVLGNNTDSISFQDDMDLINQIDREHEEAENRRDEALEASDKNYELTDDSKSHDGVMVYRIKALRDIEGVIGPINKGDVGGYVQSEDNLSNDIDDNSWVYDYSIVHGDSKVSGHSSVQEGSIIKDSEILDGSLVERGSKVFETQLDHSKVIYSDIKYSRANHSKINDSNINHGLINQSNIEKGSEVDGASITKSTVTNSARICDLSSISDSHIDGVELKNKIIIGNEDQADIIKAANMAAAIERRDLKLSDDDLKGLEDSDNLQI